MGIWVEAREIEGAVPRLRGEIEDLDSHVRAGVTCLADIDRFVRRSIDTDHTSDPEPEWEHS